MACLKQQTSRWTATPQDVQLFIFRCQFVCHPHGLILKLGLYRHGQCFPGVQPFKGIVKNKWNDHGMLGKFWVLLKCCRNDNVSAKMLFNANTEVIFKSIKPKHEGGIFEEGQPEKTSFLSYRRMRLKSVLGKNCSRISYRVRRANLAATRRSGMVKSS